MVRLNSWLAALALAFVCTQALPADDKETGEPVHEIGAGVSAPRLTHHVDPEFPPHLKGVRIEGSVAIELVVDSHGNPKNPRVTRSLEKDVDQSALDAVKQWRFDPAKKQSKPVAVRVTVEIAFHSL